MKLESEQLHCSVSYFSHYTCNHLYDTLNFPLWLIKPTYYLVSDRKHWLTTIPNGLDKQKINFILKVQPKQKIDIHQKLSKSNSELLILENDTTHLSDASFCSLEY